MKYSIKEIASVMGVKPDCLTLPNAEVSELLTDSRSLTYPEESLFFAIKTKNNDGHLYIADLYKKGVKNFVVESLNGLPYEQLNANFLVVKDSVVALQALATYHRCNFNIPVIGITGSKGKTTVKEWLYQLLRDDFKIVRSPRSYNSQIGVPLSLWDIDDNTSLAIIEAGISQPDEMVTLQSMIRPTIGVITNLGNEHNEGFYSMQQKAEEKVKLFTNCDAVVYCADDQLISDTINPILEVAQEMAWSAKNAHHTIFLESVGKVGRKAILKTVSQGDDLILELPFNDDLSIANVLCCVDVMIELGISPNTIAERVAKLTPVDTRINVIEGVNDCMVIADSYTSDYNSLSPAINFMARRATASRTLTVIVSDVMKESYRDDNLYQRIADLMRQKNIDRVIGIGPDMCAHSQLFDVNSEFYQSTRDFLENTSPSDFEDELILVKGAPEFEFQLIVDRLEAKQHQTVLEVNLDALAHNFNFFRSLLKPETKMVCMLKASGYGAGSYELAKTLQDRHCDYIAVAVTDEGVDLRKAGITMPIMVLNPLVVNYKTMFSYQLEPEVFSIDECRTIIKEAEKYGISNYPVHIKLDTGMHRLGFVEEQLPELIELLNSQQAIRPASIFSHLAVADEPEKDDYTMQQFAIFNKCCDMIEKGVNCQQKILRHILNSSGIVRFPEMQCDMVRLGIGLYGIPTLYDGSESELKPVSALHSVIISIKEWEAGTTIGYGRKGVLTRRSRIATIPVGYADGIDRHFSNGTINMWVNGTLCPTIGNICMDACMIDVTEATCQVGDHVEIFGEHIPVEALAEVRGTIPYEVLTSISQRVKRVYYRE